MTGKKIPAAGNTESVSAQSACTYTCSGIVSIEYADAPNVIFIPDVDHTVNHLGKRYAIFLCPSTSSCAWGKAYAVPFSNKAPVKIKTNDDVHQKPFWTLLALAASESRPVDVEVEINKEDNTLCLCRPTIPARQHKG